MRIHISSVHKKINILAISVNTKQDQKPMLKGILNQFTRNSNILVANNFQVREIYKNTLNQSMRISETILAINVKVNSQQRKV